MPRTDDPPEEHSHTSTTGGSVGGACANILPIQLAETAGALRAQHGPTEQAQGRVLPFIICRLGTPENKEQRVEHLQQIFHKEKMNERTSISLLLKMAGLIEESTVILRKINQTIPSPGVSAERVK